MAKSKKRKKPRASKTQHRILNREQISISREAEYIISRAKEYDSRVVSFGPLVFFSSETGDAWMIDPEDHFALWLAQGGEPQPYSSQKQPLILKLSGLQTIKLKEMNLFLWRDLDKLSLFSAIQQMKF